APNGRRYKPLFAPLVVDLDNRVNVNVHGNARGQGNTHASNQGWGPWEVNLGRVLGQGNEAQHLLIGSTRPGLLGRYGGAPWAGRIGTPGARSAQAPVLLPPHVYAQVDYDACQEQAGFVPSKPLLLPGAGAPPLSCFPL